MPSAFPSFPSTDDFLQDVVADDVRALIKAAKSYGDSWRKRGGVGAFMMLARKWDRLENRLANPPEVEAGNSMFSQYDIFGAVIMDERAEGVIDDIRDLRRYLILVEAHLRSKGACPGALAKDLEPTLPKPRRGKGAIDSPEMPAEPTAATLHPG